MPLYDLAEHQPKIHPSAFVAPSADIIGQVTLHEQTSVWFGAVVRGDTEKISIGARTNVQDGAVLHADPGFPCVLEADVTVGHKAIVHGAHCEQGSLVGIGAVMLNGSRLGAGAILGAGAVLPEGAVVPSGMLAVGIPARTVKPVSHNQNAARYVENAQLFLQNLYPTAAKHTQPGESE